MNSNVIDRRKFCKIYITFLYFYNVSYIIVLQLNKVILYMYY